jgi:VanZ family protein
VILFLSFARAETFSKVNFLGIPNLDKAVHICMYFAFTIVILYENRLILKNIRVVFMVAIIPLVFGSAIELGQSWLTTTRTGDILDELFNFFGIILAVSIYCFLINRSKKVN